MIIIFLGILAAGIVLFMVLRPKNGIGVQQPETMDPTKAKAVEYAARLLGKNIPEDKIQKKLSDAGWRKTDADEIILAAKKKP